MDSDIFRYILFAIHFLVSLTLIVLVISNTNKAEGLGVVGGQSSAPSRGRAGREENLARWTAYVAATFFVLSMIIYFFSVKLSWH